MTANTESADNILASLQRGTAELITVADLQRKLQVGRPLRVKAGFDPTAPQIHLGHTVLIEKLRQFQEAQHEVIVLIGDFTARIGDPSGQSMTRPPLSPERIRHNAATYREQIFQILDPERTRIEWNSRWMNTLGTDGLIRLAAGHTVARMLEREDFKQRYEAGRAIAIHEFLYPLIQAYDSVALRADVELGGTDQKFNLLLGRQLQESHGQTPQVIMTLPILEGYTRSSDKMSKSLGNHIGISDPPDEIYGKLMRIDDDKMWHYYTLLSSQSGAAQEALRAAVAQGMNPRDAKMQLASELVSRFHGPAASRQAQDSFLRRFQARQAPSTMPQLQVNVPDEGLSISNVLKSADLVSSTSEARRLIAQGAVRMDGERVAVHTVLCLPGGHHEFQIGKRKWARIQLVREAATPLAAAIGTDARSSS